MSFSKAWIVFSAVDSQVNLLAYSLCFCDISFRFCGFWIRVVKCALRVSLSSGS